jgi:ribosomal protein L40E
MFFAILILVVIVLGIVVAFMPFRRSVVCPNCNTRNSSSELQCSNCKHLGLRGKVFAGGVGPARVTWTCQACKTVARDVTCKRCGASLLKLFTT